VVVLRCRFYLFVLTTLLGTISCGYAQGADLSPWIYQRPNFEVKTIAQEKVAPKCQPGSWRYHTQKDIWHYCNHKGIWTLWALPKHAPNT